MKDSPTPPDSDAPGWLDSHPKAKWLATSRTTGYFSVAVVVLVVVLVLIILVLGRGDEAPSADSTSAQTTTATMPAPPADSNGPGGFGPSTADPFGREISVPINDQGQVLPQTDPGQRPAFTPGTPVPAPEGITWQRIGATVAPFSTSDGPTRIEGRLAYGFSHTPQGAALAGFHIGARGLRSGEDLWLTYERQYVADPGVIERQRAHLAASGDEDFQVGRALVFPEAFKITSYSDGFAIVQYAFPTSGGGRWIVGQNSLVWTDDGWKIRLTDVQTPQPQISTLNGWTRW